MKTRENGDLSGMDAELLSQFGQGLVAFDAANATCALKIPP
jgi:hypothetical protein